MARQPGVTVESNFSNGLITEASGLTFPENACTETYNCVFQNKGSVERRLGFDFELNYTTKNIDRSNVVVNSYVWKNVSGKGDVTILVMQVGTTVYFYRMDGDNISSGDVLSNVTLTPVSGAPSPGTVEAQFTDGNGLLFITHPYCELIRVAYNTGTDTATPTDITIQIRDFEGATADPYTITERPTATLAGLNVSHKYNLYNQGWNTTNLTAWDTSQTTMPSNADVMWTFKNSSDAFDMATLNNVIRGNTPAPKGHYILTLSNQNRDSASGLSGVASTTTGSERPSTAAFFAGRLFYSGINYSGFNSKIYFTQVVERLEQYGFCYQVNDPTSEDSFDLLPTDGGVISIPEAGTITKLMAVPGGLVVFALNGVWYITGSSGLGFTANDYTVQKISSVECLTASSFVDIQGTPSWWNTEGIYVLQADGNIPKVVSITDEKIKEFFNDIPLSSKRFARGFYDNINNNVKWLYKSTETEQVTEIYEFDRVLVFNVKTGAFYPWTVSNSDVKIHGVFISDSVAGDLTLDTVMAGADNVVDGSSNQIISFSAANLTSSPSNKYIVSYPSGSTYSFTFAETSNSDYVDWFLYDAAGVNYDSYFITGYKLAGQGIRKHQTNYINVFSELDNPVAYYIQGLWDYATTGNSGRWSSRQIVEEDFSDYSVKMHRRKIRGAGKSLQIKITSVDGINFNILGWSTLSSVNQTA